MPRDDASLDEDLAWGAARVVREVATERDPFNAHGTFYELPADHAGGFAKIRPVATHNRRSHDFCSSRGLFAMTGDADDADHSHIIRSDDDKAAVWAGAIDDAWRLGKPHGSNTRPSFQCEAIFEPPRQFSAFARLLPLRN